MASKHLAFAVLCVTVACAGPPPGSVSMPKIVTSMAITGTGAINGVRRTSALTATATFSDGTTLDVTSSATWSSSATAVASVSSSGVVTAASVGTSTVTASYLGTNGTLVVTITNTPQGPGNAHRMIAWAAYEKLILFTDADLDKWKARGVDGFVIQTRYLRDMGGLEMWTDDPNDPLNKVIIEGADVHERQRALRDTQFAARCHARGMTAYLGIYLSNYHNLATPLKVWNDDAGWASIIPTIRGAAGAAKLLGMDGIATDSENYRSDDQTWDWTYPGVTQNEATVRSLARQRGRAFMDAVLAGFPNVAIINYRLEVPGDWEEKVQAQVNNVTGVWDKSVFPDFWGGIVDAGGFSSIQFFDPIFYKSWQIGGAWEPALEYNVNGVRNTLSKRWANWDYAATRFFISPFAWIDPGPSNGSFDDARPVDYVAAQLAAFHKWGEGNTFGLYTQHIDEADFDYTPYVPAMKAASTPDGGASATSRLKSIGDDSSSVVGRGVDDSENVARDGAGRGAGMSLRLDGATIERVATGLEEPTDAAFVPDGRLFITEREGRIRIVRDGTLTVAPAVILDDVRTIGGGGLLAIAAGPDFDRTHFVYVVYTATASDNTPVFRLARFREVKGTLADRAILVDSVPASPASTTASLRFGLDGKLFAAFGADGDPNATSIYDATILRFNVDGSTPSDQPSLTPAFGNGFAVPGGLDWQPGTRDLWTGGKDPQHIGRLRVVGQPDAALVESSALAFYKGDLFPSLAGSLLVARSDSSSITRLLFDPSDSGRIVRAEPLLENAQGVIRVLVVSADGAIYFCSGDALFRVVAR
jgi:glucose/arabinose dehydrogenase